MFFIVQAENENLKRKYAAMTTLTTRFITQSDDELNHRFDSATMVEFWVNIEQNNMWTAAGVNTWNSFADRNSNNKETSHILPAFQRLVNQHNSNNWVLVDTHSGWEKTTQDFILHLQDKESLSPAYVGAIIELTGQDEQAYPDRRHKAKFLRDLLRMHILRGSEGFLTGIVLDMHFAVCFKISGPAEEFQLRCTTITTTQAMQWMGAMLNATPEELGGFHIGI